MHFAQVQLVKVKLFNHGIEVEEEGFKINDTYL